MLVSAARTLARQFVRQGGDSTMYPVEQIDNALMAVCNRFMRVTACLKATSDVALSDGVATVTVSGVTGFRPERMLGAYISGKAEPLTLIDFEALNRLSVNDTTPAAPQSIAWADFAGAVAQVYPVPDADYTMKLLWWKSQPAWTPGGAGSSGASVVMALPDDYLAELIPLAVPPFIQKTEPEMRYAGPAWQAYLEFENGMKGMGNLAVKAVYRRADP